MITLSASSILLILLAVFLGAVLTLAGAALGGLLVFRTRKEPGAGLFRVGQEKGDAFLLDDYEGGIDEIPVKPRGPKAVDDPVPSIVAKQTERFLSQLKNKKEG